MIRLVENRFRVPKTKVCPTNGFDTDTAIKVLKFHRDMPQYKSTPLWHMDNLSKYVGVKAIYVKDESFRFGLNSFKALGGSYAIGSYLNEHGNSTSVTFISATDGNHGRGVAWMAKNTGNEAIILLPKGSALSRLEHIRSLGARAFITDLNYDDTVLLARKLAEENGWIIVQDTAWEGYEEIPVRIMQGYMTMAYESVMSLNGIVPTHVFVQAGVGALAGAVIGFLANIYTERMPLISIVEAQAADCIFRSIETSKGESVRVDGDLRTIMAGLACGEPNPIGYEIIKTNADFLLSISDDVAARGMRILANPVGNDERIIAGESGAAGFGALMDILRFEEYAKLRKLLNLNEDSVILVFNTEGDTDENGYRKIVWDANEDLSQ